MALDPNERIKIRKRRGKQFEFELELGRQKVEVTEALRTNTPMEGNGYGDIASAQCVI